MSINWQGMSELEIIEALAEHEGMIFSEDQASEQFDQEIMPMILEQHGEKGVAFEDETLVNQAFCNWIDSLVTGGDLHEEQASNYSYCGEWA